MTLESRALTGGDYDGKSFFWMLLIHSKTNTISFLVLRSLDLLQRINFVSNVGNNQVVYAIAVGERNIYFFLIITNLLLNSCWRKIYLLAEKPFFSDLYKSIC